MISGCPAGKDEWFPPSRQVSIFPAGDVLPPAAGLLLFLVKSFLLRLAIFII
jgi:hypothetical protein